MPGLGTKLFIQGDVLSADDVNGYFMSQVIMKFLTASARDSAFGDGVPISVGGSGKPSLSPGMVCFVQYQSDGTTPLNQIQYYNGSQWQSADQFTVEDNAVTTAKIANSAVTSAKIADSAVTSAKIADGAIVNADINAAAAIELGKLADATINMKTANYSLVLTDKNKFIKMNSSSNRTITVPLQDTANFPEGAQIHIIRYGSGTLEVVGESGAVFIYATPGKFLRAQYSSATLLKCADTNVWMLMGDLSAS
jgi:hypothetical protein